jgi:hypothetical protein
MQAFHQYGVGSRPALYNTKRVHSTRSRSDKVYQFLVHDQWFSPGTPASSTTKTGRHDIAEMLLNLAFNIKNQSINQSYFRSICRNFGIGIMTQNIMLFLVYEVI